VRGGGGGEYPQIARGEENYEGSVSSLVARYCSVVPFTPPAS
jgi:hypothetical protein